MRECNKEAPAYLAVMSADPRVPLMGNPPSNQVLPDPPPSSPPLADGGGGGGREEERANSSVEKKLTSSATTTITAVNTTTAGRHSSNNSIQVDSEDDEEEEEEEEVSDQVRLPGSGSGASLVVHSRISAATESSGGAGENTKSAFEIISVSAFDTAEDLEQSKGMLHEADSFMEDPTKMRGQSESSESEEILRMSLGAIGTGDKHKTATVPAGKEQFSDPNERVLSLEGGATNGPVVQSVPRRFRRVNKYERGRWVIEDTLEHREAEERPESEMRGMYPTAQGTTGRGSAAGNMGQGRDSPFQRRKPGTEGGGGGAGGGVEDSSQLHSRSSSDVGGHGPNSPPNTGERDGYHPERGGEGTANLSRNTSFSSLTTAGDKSVDGDHSSDRMSQLKDESESEITSCPPSSAPSLVAGGNSSGGGATISPPQVPRHGQATVSAHHVTSATPATSDSGGEDSLSGKSGVHRVEEALFHLNKELQRLVEENKEITRLKDLNRTLEDANRRLTADRRRLEDENHELRTKNTALDNTNNTLRQGLEELTLSNEQLKTQLQKQQNNNSQSTFYSTVQQGVEPPSTDR